MTIEKETIYTSESEKVLPEKMKRSFVAFGVVFILLGILFLIKQIGLIEITWPLILMIIGGASIVRAWLNRSSSEVFTGVFLLLLGLIFLADSNTWISGGVSHNWPLVILAMSVAQMISSVVKRDLLRNWKPRILLLAVGLFLLVVEYNWIQWGKLNEILQWWPITLLLIGAWFLFRNTQLIRKSQEDSK